MANAIILSRLKVGLTLADVLKTLHGTPSAGKAITLTPHDYAVPYLEHVVAGFVDGPPSSRVAAVLSGHEPDSQHWRRFTISRIGSRRYQLDVFPTPFNNSQDPLSPGIPPGTSLSEEQKRGSA